MAKVVQFNRFGGPEVLQLSEVDVSSPLPDEIQIQVKALGISHADTVLRTGKHVVQPEFPARLGFEAAGDVIAVGAACQDLKIGDRVAVIPLGCMKAGTYAEIINVRAACAVRISHDVTYEQAAATWLDYLLAYSALVETAKVHAGDHIIIADASSGSGIAAIQMSRMLGASTVALTRSHWKKDLLRSLGASHVLHSTEDDLLKYVRGVTDQLGASVALDFEKSHDPANLREAVSPTGTLLRGSDTLLEVNACRPESRSNASGHSAALTFLARARSFVEGGLKARDLSPVIDRIFFFDEIEDAHLYAESGNQIGKIIVRI